MEDVDAFPPAPQAPCGDDTVSDGLARALLRVSTDAVIVLDGEGRLTFASPSATDLTGYRVEDRLGDGVLDLVHPDDLDVVAHSLANTTGVPGRAVPLRFRIVRRDGVVRLVEAVATNLLDDAEVRGVVVNLDDLTDREDALSTLQVAENRFRRMLENISDTVTLVDRSGEVIDTTGNVKAILGYPSTFWSMRNAFELVHPDDVDLVRRLLLDLLESPGREVSGELRVRHAEGGWETVEATAVNLLDDEDVRAIVITSRNVSARKRVEAELAAARDEAVRALEVRTEFIASVSHELRTPIHGILGLSELLATADVDDETRSLARSIGRATESLRMVLDDLLDFTKIEAGRLKLQVEAVALREVLEDLQTLFGPQASAKGVDLRIELDPSLPAAVEADPLRLRQVLHNLVGNAVKFTADGAVTVRVSPGAVAAPAGEAGGAGSAPPVVFSVEDTGIGMAPQVVAHVFEPFSQAHATTAREYGGTGLGLTIARRLVELMGGELEVATEPGVGSTFTFSVPMLVPAPVPGTTDLPGEALPAPAVANRRVVVVEDNPVNQLLVARQLERLGYEPVVLDGGAAALEHLEHDVPDVVLMDWQMPHMDGLETTRRIREREAASGAGRVPIVAMTASALPGDRARCLEAGMDDFVSKPVSLAALGRVLAAWTPLAEPGEAGASHGEGAVDRAVLERLVDELGGAAVVAVVVATYLRELPSRLTALVDAVRNDDRSETAAIAHTLKSTSAAVGATRLSAACSRLEAWGRELDDGVVDPATVVVEVRALASSVERSLSRELVRLRS